MSNTIYHTHHIIPKHIGGTDDQSNLIKLTVEEHAEAHRILYVQHNRWQDNVAWRALSGQISSDEARRIAVSKANTGRKQSIEHVQKRVNARLKTRPHSTLGQKNKPCSEERKRKISEANKGGLGRPQPHSEETKTKLSNAAKKRTLFKCPSCGAEMYKANLARYHGLNGEKCKSPLSASIKP